MTNELIPDHIIKLYNEGNKDKKPKHKIVLKICLLLVIISHHMGLWMITTSVPLLLIKEPPWISLPLCAWIMHLTFNRLDCPYTKLENSIRRKLGMEEISTFISHYYMKPYHRRFNATK